MNLYQIPLQYRSVMDKVERQGGELFPDDEVALAGINTDLNERAEAYCVLIREAGSEAMALRAESRYMLDRARQAEDRAERLKELLLKAMDATKTDKISTGRFTMWSQVSGNPSVRWNRNIEELPTWAQRVNIEIDKEAVLKAYKAGSKLEGFEINRKRYLMIR